MTGIQMGVTAALLFALLLTGWLQRQLQLDQRVVAVTDTPDYYLEHFTSIAYDSDGAPTTWLEAAQLAHHPGDDSFRLIAPRIRWRMPQQPEWQARAETGWADAAGTEVELRGGVELRRVATQDAEALSLHTEQLRFWPKDKRLVTDSAVVLRQGGSHRIAAVGLRADLREPTRIEFLSQVRTQHVAN